MGIAITELTPVERTAFVTQYARALDSRCPRPILGDTLADEIVAKIDYDFHALGVPSSAVRQTALRDELVPAGDHAYSVAASLADDDWADSIPSDRPTMLIADGLLAFLPESVIINLFRHIPEHFRSGELALNDYGRVSRSSLLAMKVVFSAVGNQWAYRGFNDAHVPETWSPRLTLVEETSLFHAPEVDLYPAAARLSTRLMEMTKGGARTARILRYRF
jgi:O-methyltransferase involved in polyketide biosynthesis